jgi:hypothetical protein
LRYAAALFALWSTCLLAAGPDAEQIRNTAKEVVKNLEVQSKLPNDSGDSDAATARPRSSPFGFGGNSIYLPGGAAILGLLQWAVIVVLVIGILALGVILIREPMQERFRPTISPPLPLEGAPPPPPDPRELLARADKLAAEGRFAEAMHCVLLAAMILIGGDGMDSQTSWELLRESKLPASQLKALRDLVIRVERAWFGQRPVAADDYQHVRGIFDAFQRPAAETA